MIYIRIALWPGGHMHNDRTLNEITITNDGTGSASVGNYDVVISRRGGFKGSGRWRILLPDPKSVWRRIRLEGFPRKSRGAIQLLFRALSQLEQKDR